MPPAKAPDVKVVKTHDKEIVIVSHSNLFYWWPVWAVGFLVTILSLPSDNYRMAFVPPGTEAFRKRQRSKANGKEEKITLKGATCSWCPMANICRPGT